MSRSAPVLVLLALTCVPLTARAQLTEKWGVPGSSTGRAVAVVLEMIERGDEDFTRESLEEHFTDAYVDGGPMEARLATFRDLHGALPGIRPAGLRRTPSGAVFTVRSPSATTEVRIALEVDATGRIAGLTVQEVETDGAGEEERRGTEGGPDAPLGATLSKWAEEDRFSGVVLDTWGGSRRLEGAYGFADKRFDVPNTLDTRFNVGSLNKAFTGAAILLLEREGRVELDAPIGRYLEGFPDDVANSVTVRHLLQHRSGWGHYWENETFRANLAQMREISDYLTFIREIPLDFEPGTDRRYSNVGYEVLGGIIEAVTGRAYREYVREAVLEPLGMEDTGFFARDRAVARVAVGYTTDHPFAADSSSASGYVMENTYLLPPVGTAAGGAYATAGDLVRFFSGLLEGEILDRRGFALIMNDFDQNADFPSGPSVLAGGGPGVRASVLVHPAADHIAVVLSNYDTPLVSRIVERLERQPGPAVSGDGPGSGATAASGATRVGPREEVGAGLSVSPETRRAVAMAVADRLEESYVLPDAGRQMAQRLRVRTEAYGWPESGSATAFARALTIELQQVRSDLHLQILPPGDPRADGTGGERRRIRVRPGSGEREGEVGAGGRYREPPVLHPDLPTSFRVPDGTPISAVEARMADRLEQERDANHYLRRAEVMPGNVGYLALDQFPIMPFAAPALDAVMSYLARVDAFILDLRGNPGGGEGLGQYLASFFFDDEPVHLYSRYYATEDTTREYWTLPHVPPVRMPDVPVLVLIDGASGSAAENLAFSLANTERATLVGERTAGAGLSSTRVELPGGFSMVLPIARVFDPRTDRDFEGTGVEPDVRVESGRALWRAHEAAVEALKGRAADAVERQELDRAASLVRARSLPPLSAEELAAYAGHYGPRRIRVGEGGLVLRRTDVPRAPELPLLRVGPDAFVVERLPEARLEFTRGSDGSVTGLRVRNPNGRWEMSERSAQQGAAGG